MFSFFYVKKTPEQKILITLSDLGAHWQLKAGRDKLLFNIGVQKISILKAGIMDAINGEYDFSVGAINGQNIWFWKSLSHIAFKNNV